MSRTSVVCIASVATLCVMIPAIHAAEIYGGPAFDSTTGTGYLGPDMDFTRSTTAGNGIGICHATKYIGNTDLGYRACRWDITGSVELGHLGTNSDGITETMTQAVNMSGTVVGSAYVYSGESGRGPRAVRWDAGSTVATELGHIGLSASGFANCHPYAINASGTIVGFSSKLVGELGFGDRAVRWDAGGTAATELGHLGTDTNGRTICYAEAVNDAGVAVGSASKYVGGTNYGVRAVRWDPGSTVATELGHLGTASDGRASSGATGINSSGVIIGYAFRYSGSTFLGNRAVRWDAGTTTAIELSSLGADGTGYATSRAAAINDAGTIVGRASKSEGSNNFGDRAVRWSAGSTTAVELGNLGTDDAGYTTSGASAVNASGQIVGGAMKYVDGVEVGPRPVLWGLDGVAIDLNTLLSPADAEHWTLTSTLDISDTNWVTGAGMFDPDGAGPLEAYLRAFLMRIPGPGCPADLDNGTSTGTPDGAVDINDLLHFLLRFEEGDQDGADLDNGTGTGTPDNAVDINDLLYFLVRFEAGC